MEYRPTSDDLLAHFDRPNKLELYDFEWDERALPREAEIAVGDHRSDVDCDTERFVEVPEFTRRGIGSVLAWVAATAVIVFAAGVLLELAYVFAAERALSIAARAGAMEATLPRATLQSVTATVERRLSQYPLLAKQLHVTLLQNGAPIQTLFRQADGDRFTVSLSAPGSSAIPEWLRGVTMLRREADIHAQAEKTMPGRTLKYTTSKASH